MKMKIEISTDWQQVHRLLKAEMTAVGYNSDFDKMLKNIDSMVSMLSKIEVVARRTRNTVLHTEHVTKINQAIDHLSKVLIMAKLMR